MPTTAPIRIADIQTTNVLYYDPLSEGSYFEFCKLRDIDCLPALDDRNRVYRRDEAAGVFVDEEVTEERRVEVRDNIFSPDMLARFRTAPLLLTYDHSELQGVVHFSDYSKPVVSVYLYQILFDYEKALRDLLREKGLGNGAMLDYFQQQYDQGQKRGYYQDELERYRRRADENERLPLFQTFYFRDLINLAVSQGIPVDADEVNRLRNSIMHAHELVVKEDHTVDNLIYDFDSFEDFFSRARRLLLDYKRVRNLLAFERS